MKNEILFLIFQVAKSTSSFYWLWRASIMSRGDSSTTNFSKIQYKCLGILPILFFFLQCFLFMWLIWIQKFKMQISKTKFHPYLDGWNSGILLPWLFWPTVRKICSSVILNFSRVMRPRKVSREIFLQIRGRRPRICNVFEIHFSWPQYSGKIQNYIRTN